MFITCGCSCNPVVQETGAKGGIVETDTPFKGGEYLGFGLKRNRKESQKVSWLKEKKMKLEQAFNLMPKTKMQSLMGM